MKKIAVLTHDLTIEYSLEILNGISEYFKDKEVQLIIGQVKEPHCKTGIYEYQCWSATSYLFSDQIDGVIVIYGSFSITNSREQLSALLSQFPEKPIFCVSAALDLPNSYSTQTESKSVYTKVIKHLVEQHGCSKIGFMSANLTNSSEAKERYSAFIAALQKNNIPFNQDYVLDGAFTMSSSYEAILKKYKSKNEVPFDAILCANDLMALGCEQALQSLGVKIPKDVKIIGFDDTSHATSATPKLSTINQMIFYQGYKIGEMAYKKLTKNAHLPKINSIKATPLYRQSCGCIDLKCHDDVYKTQDLKICRKEVQKKNSRVYSIRENTQFFNFLPEINNIYTFFDLTSSSSTLRSFSYTLPYLMSTMGISSLLVCFFERPVILHQNDDFVLPEKMRVSMMIDSDSNIQEFEPNIIFNPQEEIFPKGTFKGKSGNYILFPIFSGEKNYGYIICHLLKPDFSIYCVFLKILVNSISQAYEFTSTTMENQKLSFENQQLIQYNSNLTEQSKTDELTKILNRRGFFEAGQKRIELATTLGSFGLVLFADLDNLKTINDTYGHKMGDEAIKTLALVFNSTFRGNDVIGRISGDEFAVITLGMTPEQFTKVRVRFDELCKNMSEKQKLPFVISCSIGYASFPSEQKTLAELLSAADKELYKEKRIKHGNSTAFQKE